LVALESSTSDDPGLGGKARGLLRLIRAGLPVPKTLVLPAAVYSAVHAAGQTSGHASVRAAGGPAANIAALAATPLGARLVTALDQALKSVGTPVMVRSSATIEDSALTLAPGIFTSVGGVADLAALVDAVCAVWASLDAPLARRYRQSRGLAPEGATMAVVLEPDLSARARAMGTLYTRTAADDGLMLIEIGGGPEPELVAVARSGGRVRSPSVRLSADDVARLVALGLGAEYALGADGTGGVDLEWLLTDTLLAVQARPLPPRAARPRAWPVTRVDDGPGADRVWIWDAAHNPAPLSPAQAGLVELVDAAGAAPGPQRVIDGYLYAARAPSGAEADTLVADAGAGADAGARADAAARPDALATDAPFAELEARLSPLETEPPAPLDRSLEAYVTFYRGYAALSARLGRDRAALVAALGARVGSAQAPSLAAALIGATGAAQASLRALAWDVAEAPPSLTRAAPLAPAPRPAPAAPAAPPLAAPSGSVAALAGDPALRPLITRARRAAALAEHDDALFARAQAGVRRSLAAIADRWGVPLDDVMHLPLPEVAAHAHGAPPQDLGARAAAARARRAAQAATPPPERVAGTVALDRPRRGGAVIAGTAGLGHAEGPVFRLDRHPDRPVPPGSIAVAPTILPGMALLVSGAAGLVAAHGGVLGHGAALARELGLAHVVGAREVLALLDDGDRAALDGDRALVLKL
jgi:pyruvate,water dikinase